MFRRIVVPFTLTVSCLLTARAGAAALPNTPQDEKPVSQADSLRQRALDALRDVSDQASQMKDASSRAELLSAVAATLWKYDQESARELLKRGIDLTEGSTYARGRFLAGVSRIDPALASEWVSKAIANEPFPASTSNISEAALIETEIASALSGSNARESATWLIRSFQRGFDTEQTGVWETLFRVDPSEGTRVFDAVLELTQRPAPQGTLAGILLVTSSLENTDPVPVRKEIDASRTTALLSIIRRLLAADSSDFGNQPLAPSIPTLKYALAQSSLPIFQRFAPDQAREIEDQIKSLSGSVSAEERMPFDQIANQQTLGPDVDPEDTEAIAGLARRATSRGRRDSLYARAADVALDDQEYAGAMGFASKISSSILRDGVVRRIVRNMLRFDPVSTDLLDAYRAALKVEDPQARIEALAEIAQAAAARGDLIRALELIREAEISLDKISSPDDRALSSFHVVAITSAFDAVRAFEAMASAVKRANALESGQAAGKQPSCLTYADFIPSFTWLGRTDFDRALLLASDLQRDECRLFARWAVAAGFLSLAVQSPATPAKK